jgi:hypothetical protein
VTNECDMPHDFSIEELDISTGAIMPGEAKTTTFKVPDDTTTSYAETTRGMDGTIEGERDGGRADESDRLMPSSPWVDLDRLPVMHAPIDAAAEAAGRKPSDVRRVYRCRRPPTRCS